MPRFALLLSLMLLGLVSLTPVAGTKAQDATPAATPGGMEEGINLAPLARGSMEILAPGTADLAMLRVRLDPGATLPFDPNDPSVALLYMTSGELTFRVEAPMTVARAVGAGTPVPEEPEAIPAGTEFTMRDGDSALFPPLTAGEARNDGDEEATALVANIAVRSSGTPTP